MRAITRDCIETFSQESLLFSTTFMQFVNSRKFGYFFAISNCFFEPHPEAYKSNTIFAHSTFYASKFYCIFNTFHAEYRRWQLDNCFYCRDCFIECIVAFHWVNCNASICCKSRKCRFDICVIVSFYACFRKMYAHFICQFIWIDK